MKAINITERIRQIKDHIGRASLKLAMDDLDNLIRSIDGMEVENHDEREFINQLTIIKARYNSFNDSVIMDVGAKQQELNQITSSLLILTDSVHELLANNPDLIIPEPQREITANLAIPKENIPTSTHPIPSTSGADNGGFSYSSTKTADQTNVKIQINPLKLFGGLSIFVLTLAFAIWLTSSLNGCKRNLPLNPPRIKKPVTHPPQNEPPPKALDESLNIRFPENSSKSVKNMTNMINKGKTTGRGQINFSNILFGRNEIKLNDKAKKELDDMAMVLKQAPDQTITLLATIGPDESTSYRGNKELTLGDIRARAMFNYLKSKGVPMTQMEFEGGGVSDQQRVMVELY